MEPGTQDGREAKVTKSRLKLHHTCYRTTVTVCFIGYSYKPAKQLRNIGLFIARLQKMRHSRVKNKRVNILMWTSSLLSTSFVETKR